MISEKQCIALVFLCLVIGVVVGMFLWYSYGTPKCEHKYEKILGTATSTAYMCTKCGKRKITRL